GDAAGRAPADRPARRTDPVYEELAIHLARHPAAAGELWQANRFPRPAVDPDADAATRGVMQVYAVLAFAFDRARSLGRPVALPGFVNGQLCVVVLESRETDAVILEPCPKPHLEPWV